MMLQGAAEFRRTFEVAIRAVKRLQKSWRVYVRRRDRGLMRDRFRKLMKFVFCYLVV